MLALNAFILFAVTSSGSKVLNAAVLDETKAEVAKGWADGLWRLDQFGEESNNFDTLCLSPG